MKYKGISDQGSVSYLAEAINRFAERPGVVIFKVHYSTSQDSSYQGTGSTRHHALIEYTEEGGKKP